ncbi:hypothetical protein Q1695_012047 [Nippostrongylus brasiliensis]|nr:hypothetical protein Q1695_012047 [Nippostrongylus brasiliensis]
MVLLRNELNFENVFSESVEGGYEILAVDVFSPYGTLRSIRWLQILPQELLEAPDSMTFKRPESDAGPFRTFRLKTLLEESVRLFPAGCDHGLEGVVDYHILANGGFAQTTWMQRSFGQPEVANDMLKAHFNECFSSARRMLKVPHNLLAFRIPAHELSRSDAQLQRMKLVRYFARRDGLR